jgi:hypothetical protein
MLPTLYTRQRAADIRFYLKKKEKRNTKLEIFVTTKSMFVLSHWTGHVIAFGSGPGVFRDEELVASYWPSWTEKPRGPFRCLRIGSHHH